MNHWVTEWVSEKVTTREAIASKNSPMQISASNMGCDFFKGSILMQENGMHYRIPRARHGRQVSPGPNGGLCLPLDGGGWLLEPLIGVQGHYAVMKIDI